MQKGFRLRDLLGKVCLPLLLALALPHWETARAEAKAIDVLPGAFGESIDTLDDAISARCIGYADRALRKLLEDFELAAQGIPQSGYLQILQTTLLLPETQPPDATDIERAIWAEIYESTACVVSFVVIDNSLNAGVVPYAEFTGRFGDYAVRQDGSVESVSLRGIRNHFFTDPVVPGVRVINMGSYYNTHYTLPDSAGVSDAKFLDGDRDVFPEGFTSTGHKLRLEDETICREPVLVLYAPNMEAGDSSEETTEPIVGPDIAALRIDDPDVDATDIGDVRRYLENKLYEAICPGFGEDDPGA